MKKMDTYRIALMVAVFSITQAAHAQDLGPGDQAPPFALPGTDGATHRLADYQGATVVLAWFPKAFTGG